MTEVWRVEIALHGVIISLYPSIILFTTTLLSQFSARLNARRAKSLCVLCSQTVEHFQSHVVRVYPRRVFKSSR